MDQMPLPFMLKGGKTYDKKGVKEVWIQNGQSGLDKRQVTIQLKVFADGVHRVGRASAFPGKGFRISAKEKQSYYRRARVMYQEKGWCDQEIIEEWVSTESTNPFKNPIGENSDGKNSNCWCSSRAINR